MHLQIKLTKLFLSGCVIVLFAGGLMSGAVSAGDDIMIRYTSTPDEVVLYLGDLAYARDTVTLPPGDIEVNFPPNVVTDSLLITENGERVPVVRFRGRNAPDWEAMLSSRSVPTNQYEAQQIVVTWPSEATESREVVLEYLMRGAGWRPVYDMTVIDEDSVYFNFGAEITTYALQLEDARVRLLSGMIAGGDMNMNEMQMTVAQNSLGYQNATSAQMPQTESVSVYHIYDLGTLSIQPGDVVRAQLVNQALDARRIVAWDTRQGERTEVIYKVTNSTGAPFVQGMVRIYEDGIYMGSDAIEWTPAGSEGSVTMAGMSDVRVRRKESITEAGDFFSIDYRIHEVTLEIGNYTGEELEITVLDTWNQYAQNFNFSLEPKRQPGNILRWDLTIPAGERKTITYSFKTD